MRGLAQEVFLGLFSGVSPDHLGKTQGKAHLSRSFPIPTQNIHSLTLKSRRAVKRRRLERRLMRRLILRSPTPRERY